VNRSRAAQPPGVLDRFVHALWANGILRFPAWILGFQNTDDGRLQAGLKLPQRRVKGPPAVWTHI
jgi:hypothetical protein